MGVKLRWDILTEPVMWMCDISSSIEVIFKLQEMEQLEREIEKLKTERMQLEFHVERTGRLMENQTINFNPLRNAHFIPPIKFWQSPSGFTKVFSRKMYFCDCKKIIWNFSVMMEQEIRKWMNEMRMKTKKTQLLMSFKETLIFATKTDRHKSKNTKPHEGMESHLINTLLTWYWPHSLYAFLWTLALSRST